MGNLFWIFMFVAILQPWLKQRLLETQRVRAIRSLEVKRKSRVITLIHRQEAMGFLGFPLFHFINIEDSEEILRGIRMTAPDCPIDVILHTPGGLVLASDQISRALRAHPGRVTVFVPHYAMSGGTLLALAADEIIMDRHAVLGPIDPQLGQHPAAAIVHVAATKPIEHLSDETLIMADVARKALSQMRYTVASLLGGGHLSSEKSDALAEKLTQGYYTHDYPISAEEAKALGLRISTDMPNEVYEIMELHPQASMGKPSVQFIPIPYGSRKDGRRT